MNAQAVDLTEQQLRESCVPTPKTIDELIAYINGLVGQEHDYGTSVYAVSLASVATFNYVAHSLGITGFQASCADMDVIRRTRRLRGPFMLIDGENALYPQYDLVRKVEEFLTDIGPWLGENARELLAKPNPFTALGVIAHWQALDISNPKIEAPTIEETA